MKEWIGLVKGVASVASVGMGGVSKGCSKRRRGGLVKEWVGLVKGVASEGGVG